jgi:undecaprenyl-diphosphatase
MMEDALPTALLLGLVEGITEFLPISSTGHLILLTNFLGFPDKGGVFAVAIQLGAILAICVAYWGRLWGVLVGLPTRREARGFVYLLLAAFLPAAVIGVLAHDFIKTVLFSPTVVAWALVAGGIAILVIERVKPAPRIHTVEGFSYATALKVGLCQVVAMIPGVSRSGATIMGALLLGVDRRAAAEFSFFLAIPTMAAATLYDLYKSRDLLGVEDMTLIGVGFAAAFVAALVVVKALVAFLARHGFTPFAWYRIALGGLLLGLIYGQS